MIYLVLVFIELFLLFTLSKLLIKSLSLFLFKFFKNQKTVIYILALLFFPGTVIHEVAHMVVSEVLFVKTGSMEFSPKINGSFVKLGSVEVAITDPIRRALIGFAPFFIGMIFISSILYFVFALDKLHHLLFILFAGYVIFEISNTMFSSRRDMEGTIELLIAVFVIIFLLFLLGVRIIPPVLPQQLISFSKTASIFFLVPLGINIFVILFCRIFLKLT